MANVTEDDVVALHRHFATKMTKRELAEHICEPHPNGRTVWPTLASGLLDWRKDEMESTHRHLHDGVYAEPDPIDPDAEGDRLADELYDRYGNNPAPRGTRVW